MLSAPAPQQLERRLQDLFGELPFEVVPGPRDEVTAVRLRAGDKEVEVA